MNKRYFYCIALVLFLVSCQSIKFKPQYQVLETDNVRIFYKDGYINDAEYIMEGLNNKYEGIITKINPLYKDPIKVRIYKSAASLKATKNYGSESSQVFVDINDRNEIMIIANSSGDIPTNFDNMRIVVIHEFSHIVTRSINSSLKLNAAWLWEAIAYYSAGQKRSSSRAKSYVDIKYLDISSKWSDPWISPLSYYIGEFIYSKWGVDGMIELIKQNGNIIRAFGISKKEYYSLWYDYMTNQ